MQNWIPSHPSSTTPQAEPTSAQVLGTQATPHTPGTPLAPQRWPTGQVPQLPPQASSPQFLPVQLGGQPQLPPGLEHVSPLAGQSAFVQQLALAMHPFAAAQGFCPVGQQHCVPQAIVPFAQTHWRFASSTIPAGQALRTQTMPTLSGSNPGPQVHRPDESVMQPLLDQHAILPPIGQKPH